MWEPSARPVTVLGLVQSAYVEPSRLHWKLACSLAVNPNVAWSAVTRPVGPPLIVVTGATRSTAKLFDAVELVRPDGSCAKTRKVWLPWAKVNVPGTHDEKGALSVLHRKVAVGSVEVKPMLRPLVP